MLHIIQTVNQPVTKSNSQNLGRQTQTVEGDCRADKHTQMNRDKLQQCELPQHEMHPAGDIQPRRDQRRIFDPAPTVDVQTDDLYQDVLTAQKMQNQNGILYDFTNPIATKKYYSKDFQKKQNREVLQQDLTQLDQSQSMLSICKANQKMKGVLNEFDQRARYAQRQLNQHFQQKAGETQVGKGQGRSNVLTCLNLSNSQLLQPPSQCRISSHQSVKKLPSKSDLENFEDKLAQTGPMPTMMCRNLSAGSISPCRPLGSSLSAHYIVPHPVVVNHPRPCHSPLRHIERESLVCGRVSPCRQIDRLGTVCVRDPMPIVCHRYDSKPRNCQTKPLRPVTRSPDQYFEGPVVQDEEKTAVSERRFRDEDEYQKIQFSYVQSYKNKGPQSSQKKSSTLAGTYPRKKAKTSRRFSQKEIELGAGNYADEKKFGDEGKHYSISRTKRPVPQTDVPGPTFYKPNHGITQWQAPQWQIRDSSKSPRRAEISPAPGQYKENRQMGKGLPNFIMGQRREEAPDDKIGPAFYNPHKADKIVRQSSPQYTVKPAHKLKPERDETLGPCHYIIDNDFKRDSKRMTIERKRSAPAIEGPDPFQYSPERGLALTKDRSKSAVFHNREKRKDKYIDPSLGPGTFNVKNSFGENLNKMTIGQRSVEKMPDQNQGPGTYDHERADKIIKVSSRQINFDKQVGRRLEEADPNLGPGTYTPKKKFGEGLQKQTIGVKRETEIQQTLGPGDYSPKDQIIRPSQRTLDFEKYKGRQNNESSPQLGPGTYNYTNEFGSELKNMTIGRKQVEPYMFDPVGPGFYSPEKADELTKFKAPQVDFAKKQPRIEELHDQNLGPGTYHQENELSPQKITIGVRREFTKESNPGPCDYSPDNRITKPNLRATDLKNQTGRQEQVYDQELGPGTYDYNLNNSPGNMMIGQKRQQVQIEGVGPGEYSPEKADRLVKPNQVKSTEFYKKTGREIKLEDSDIGPGQYHYTNGEFGSDAKNMTIGERRQEETQFTIGPGHYKVEQADPLVKQRNPSIDLERRVGRRETLVEDTPAPGQYDYELTDKRRMTIGERRDDQKVDVVPAPGQYEPSTKLTSQSGRAVDFANREQRRSNQPDDHNGPGSYDHKEFGHGLNQMTIGQKHEERPQQTAGPGDYSPNSKQTKPSARTVDFVNVVGRDNRLEESPEPGPGNYNYQKDFGSEAKNMTIGKRIPLASPDQPIGPGHYSIEKANSIIRSKGIEVDFVNQTGRPDQHVQSNVGPGDYQNYTNFGEDSRKMTIGQKYNEPIPNDNPSPGHYDHERGLSITKPKSQANNFALSTERKDLTESEHPGPGTYVVQNQFGDDMRQFTIHEKRDQEIKNDHPGPGAYQIEHADSIVKVTSPQVDFERRTGRKDQDFEQNPAPGQYYLQEKDNRQMSIGQKRDQPSLENNPGPGYYHQQDVLTKVRSPETDFERRTGRKEQTNEQSPAPGQYHFELSDNRQMSIGQKRDKPRPEDNPGPGFYDQSDVLTRVKNPEADFERRTGRKQQSYEQSPAPGQYHYELQDKRQMSIGQKRDQPRPEDNPGPGFYDQSDALTKMKSPETDFERRTGRKEQTNEQSPAPGQYHHEFQDNRQMSIGQKRDQSRPEDNPGPGFYHHTDVLTKVKSPQTDFERRTGRQEKKNEQSPSPGQYHFEFSDNRQMFIGQKRDQPRPEDNPGPGFYDQSDALTKMKSPETDFERRTGRKEQTSEQSPAPGQYHYEFQDNHQMSIGVKHYQRIDNDIPAPGQYDPDRADSITKRSIQAVNFQNQQERSSNSANQNPAPGQYYPDVEFGSDSKPISIGQKRQLQPADSNAGPGYYNTDRADTQVMRSFPVTDFERQTSRQLEKPEYEQLGPGSYDYQRQLADDLNKMTIGQKRADRPQEQSPAVGIYEVDRGFKYTQPSSQQTRFNQSPSRPVKSINRNLGPGSFDFQTDFGVDGQQFTIGEKREERTTDMNPSPGEYNLDIGLKFTSPASQASDFSKSPVRKQYSANAYPGPGSYSTQRIFAKNKKAMQMGVRREDPEPDYNLGPGQYRIERADPLVSRGDIYTDFAKKTGVPYSKTTQDYFRPQKTSASKQPAKSSGSKYSRSPVKSSTGKKRQTQQRQYFEQYMRDIEQFSQQQPQPLREEKDSRNWNTRVISQSNLKPKTLDVIEENSELSPQKVSDNSSPLKSTYSKQGGNTSSRQTFQVTRDLRSSAPMIERLEAPVLGNKYSHFKKRQ